MGRGGAEERGGVGGVLLEWGGVGQRREEGRVEYYLIGEGWGGGERRGGWSII